MLNKLIMISLILFISFIGFVAWAVTQIPMPPPFRTIIIGVLCFVAIVLVLRALGLDTGLGHIRLN